MNLKFDESACSVKEPHERHVWKEDDVLVQCEGVEDRVNHPSHYNSHPSGIEFIEVGRWFNFNVGNAMKYLWRAGLKDEAGIEVLTKHIEDLKKAQWYIADEIKRVEKELATPKPGLDQTEGKLMDEWSKVNDASKEYYDHSGIVPPHISEKIENHIASLNEQIMKTGPEASDITGPLDWNIEAPSVKRVGE